jgi:hypothetical protein
MIIVIFLNSPERWANTITRNKIKNYITLSSILCTVVALHAIFGYISTNGHRRAVHFSSEGLGNHCHSVSFKLRHKKKLSKLKSSVTVLAFFRRRPHGCEMPTCTRRCRVLQSNLPQQQALKTQLHPHLPPAPRLSYQQSQAASSLQGPGRRSSSPSGSTQPVMSQQPPRALGRSGDGVLCCPTMGNLG